MKKILSFFIALTLLASCMGVVSIVAQSEYVEADTWEELKELLESAGDKNIIVTQDMIYTCTTNDVGAYWIRLGQGEKTLNLNGKSVELNAETGVETTMIKVPAGASLIINDTSGDHSGKLFCYGKMTSPRDGEGIPRYFNEEVKHRNVLEVDGGAVTINGGTLEAGRSKKMWIYDGRDVYDLRHMLDYTLQFGALGLAIGARFDGYAWQQVNGDCITVKDGSLLVNDGIFLGRGFSTLKTFVKNDDNDVDVEFSRSACLRLSGGFTTINGGTFHGKGNADVLGATKNANVTVKGGTFSTNHLRVLSVPTINVTLTGYWAPYVIGHEQRYGYQYHPASDVGSVRLTSDMLDPQRNTAELNGEFLPVSEWSRLRATTNEGASTVVITHHMSNADRRNFMSGKDAKKEITRVNIDGTNAYGMTLSPDVLSCDTAGVRKISVEWYHNGEIADPDTMMIAGAFQAKVTVYADSGYVFSDTPSFTVMGDKAKDYEISDSKRYVTVWSKVYEMECTHTMNEDASIKFDGDKHFISCTACESMISEEAHRFDEGVTDGNVITYTCVRCDYAYQMQDDGKIKINLLRVEIPRPETGKTPGYNGDVSEGVSFSAGGDEYTQNGIRWSKYANDFGIGEDDLFCSGFRYRATIYLRVDDAYAFHKNHEGVYDTIVYVNGEQAKYEVDGNLVTVYYETNTEEVVVSEIGIKGIDFPEIGNQPDFMPESDVPYYYDAKKDAGAVTWYEDGKYMNKTDTFKAGKAYTVALYVDAIRVGWDDVVTFADSVRVTLNGFLVDESHVERLNDTTVMLEYTFPVLEGEKEEKEPEKPTESEKPSKEASFIDVSEDDYYYSAVLWAVDEGITAGTSDTTFSPDSTCTRGQVVTFLWRAAGCPKAGALTKNPFTDVKSSDYYYDAVLWAVEKGITAGTSDTTFSPDNTCSSAHIITFLYRYVHPGKNGWYEEAKDWAAKEGILDGPGLKVHPEENCPRAAVVTYMYDLND